MLFSQGVRLAIWLTSILLLSVITPAQMGRRAPETQPAAPASRQIDVSAFAARREWDASRDWLRFTTRILGDTAVTDSMKALLASGLAPGAQDRYGRTAMHAAAMLGQLDLARFLLARGAKVDARDREGRTPLMISASVGGLNHFHGFTSTSPWALPWTEKLCDLDLPEELAGNVRGLTSWHGMTTVQRPMLRLLLDAGADIAAKDSEGRDVLDHVALGGPTGFDLLILSKAAGGGQPQCNLDLARSPEVRGLRLGIGLREVTSRLRPLVFAEPEWCGRQTLEFNWGDDILRQRAPLPKDLAGVRRIKLGFLDGRLAYFRVTYDPRDAPLKDEQFRSTLSSSLGLPDSWRKAVEEGLWDRPHSVSCNGFVVVSGFDIGPYVELHDIAALDVLLQRREEAVLKRLRDEEAEEERKRRVFKP